VHPAFQERLKMFEKIVLEVATQFYGRGPERIVQLGSYNCRPIRLYPNLLSEHALGNAVDVAGFVFGRARSREIPVHLSSRLRRGFRVTVLEHWNAKRGVGAVHSEFLHALAHRLIEQTHIFRVLLGPAYPGHRNHFHFDCAPYRLVSIFGDEPS
jgi:hypothetical protein